MKRYTSYISCLILFAGLFLTHPAYAGDESSNVVSLVEQVGNAAGAVSGLTGLTKIKSDEITGWGAQVGIMLKGFVESIGDGVKMTTEEICRVADTRVGKVCTFVIVYKIIGKDLIETGRGLVRSLCGIVLLIVFVTIVSKYYKSFFNSKQVLDRIESKTESTPEIKHYKDVPSLQERIDNQEEGLSWLVLFLSTIGIAVIGWIICCMI